MAQISSHCINHVGVEAVGRCKQCGKPFCNTCQVVGPTGKFCSDKCKENHEVFTQRAHQLDSMKKDSTFMAKLYIYAKKLIVFAVAILIIAVVLAFVGVEVPFVSDFLDR